MKRTINGWTRWALLVAAATVATFGLVPPSAASAGVADQCIVKVVGQQSDGTFILGAARCFTTYAGVLRSQGDTSVSDSTTPATVTQDVLLTDAILGTHYDGSNFTGASFSVTGTTCGGGGLNLPTNWNDRISSTANGCNDIIHYQNANYGGNTYVSSGTGGNISALLDNQTTSIKYYA